MSGDQVVSQPPVLCSKAPSIGLVFARYLTSGAIVLCAFAIQAASSNARAGGFCDHLNPEFTNQFQDANEVMIMGPGPVELQGGATVFRLASPMGIVKSGTLRFTAADGSGSVFSVSGSGNGCTDPINHNPVPTAQGAVTNVDTADGACVFTVTAPLGTPVPGIYQLKAEFVEVVDVKARLCLSLEVAEPEPEDIPPTVNFDPAGDLALVGSGTATGAAGFSVTGGAENGAVELDCSIAAGGANFQITSNPLQTVVVGGMASPVGLSCTTQVGQVQGTLTCDRTTTVPNMGGPIFGEITRKVICPATVVENTAPVVELGSAPVFPGGPAGGVTPAQEISINRAAVGGNGSGAGSLGLTCSFPMDSPFSFVGGSNQRTIPAGSADILPLQVVCTRGDYTDASPTSATMSCAQAPTPAEDPVRDPLTRQLSCPQGTPPAPAVTPLLQFASDTEQLAVFSNVSAPGGPARTPYSVTNCELGGDDPAFFSFSQNQLPLTIASDATASLTVACGSTVRNVQATLACTTDAVLSGNPVVLSTNLVCGSDAQPRAPTVDFSSPGSVTLSAVPGDDTAAAASIGLLVVNPVGIAPAQLDVSCTASAGFTITAGAQRSVIALDPLGPPVGPLAQPVEVSCTRMENPQEGTLTCTRQAFVGDPPDPQAGTQLSPIVKSITCPQLVAPAPEPSTNPAQGSVIALTGAPGSGQSTGLQFSNAGPVEYSITSCTASPGFTLNPTVPPAQLVAANGGTVSFSLSCQVPATSTPLSGSLSCQTTAPDFNPSFLLSCGAQQSQGDAIPIPGLDLRGRLLLALLLALVAGGILYRRPWVRS